MISPSMLSLKGRKMQSLPWQTYIGTRAATAVTKRREMIERAKKIESIIPARAPRRWQKIVSDN